MPTTLTKKRISEIDKLCLSCPKYANTLISYTCANTLILSWKWYDVIESINQSYLPKQLLAEIFKVCPLKYLFLCKTLSTIRCCSFNLEWQFTLLFRPEYSWKIARWTLNTNQSINQSITLLLTWLSTWKNDCWFCLTQLGLF